MTYDRRASSYHIKYVTDYIRRAQALVAPYRALADVLETPKIGTYADRIELRVKDLRSEVLPRLIEAEKIMDSDGDRDRLKGLADDLKRVMVKVTRQDDGDYISWDLEDYLGPEAPILRRIERVSPGSFSDGFEGLDEIQEYLEEEN